MTKKYNNQAGFTLIELLIVIVVIGVLASIALPNLMGITDTARREAVAFNTRTLLTELEVYRFRNGSYPGSNDDSFDASDLIDEHREDFNGLAGIIEELGEYDSDIYNYQSSGNRFVFSVKIAEDDYVGIRHDRGFQGNLDNHLNLED